MRNMIMCGILAGCLIAVACAPSGPTTFPIEDDASSSRGGMAVPPSVGGGNGITPTAATNSPSATASTTPPEQPSDTGRGGFNLVPPFDPITGKRIDGAEDESSKTSGSEGQAGNSGAASSLTPPAAPAENSGASGNVADSSRFGAAVPPPVPGTTPTTNQTTESTPAASAGVGGKMGRLGAGAAAGIDGPGGVAGPPGIGSANSTESDRPQSFLDMARNRFERFDEIGGQRYLYAHWLTDDQAKEQFPLHWVTGLKEPRLFVRWGIAVALTAPEDYRDPPPVIGSGDASGGDSGNAPSRPGATGRGAPVGGGRGAGLSPPGGVSGGGVGGGAGSESLTSPRGSLLYCSGDFGARLLQRFEMRRTASPPYFGPIVASLDAAPTTENNQAGGGGRRSGVPDFSAFSGAAAPSTTNGNSDGKQWTSPNSQFTAGTLLPGVFFLGVDDGKSDKQFVEIGKQVGLDALIVVLVDVNTRRNRPATSNVGAVVYNLKTGESQKTSSLNNETVAKLREKSNDDGDDPVEKELDKLFAKFSDVQLRINDLPELKPEAVVKRVGAISTEPQPLAGIVEVVSYWRANLVDDATAMNFITDATNEELAKALLNGTDDERKKALTAWLEAHQEKPIEAANSFR